MRINRRYAILMGMVFRQDTGTTNQTINKHRPEVNFGPGAIYIYCRNLISCKAALQRLYRKKRYTNKLELNFIKAGMQTQMTQGTIIVG